MTSHMKGYLISCPTLQYNMVKRKLGIDVHVATRVPKLFCVGALVGPLTSPLKTAWPLKLEWMSFDNLLVSLDQQWPILPALELPPFLWSHQGRGATPTKETVGENLIYYITHWSCRNRKILVELKPLKENSTKMFAIPNELLLGNSTPINQSIFCKIYRGVPAFAINIFFPRTGSLVSLGK